MEQEMEQGKANGRAARVHQGLLADVGVHQVLREDVQQGWRGSGLRIPLCSEPGLLACQAAPGYVTQSQCLVYEWVRPCARRGNKAQSKGAARQHTPAFTRLATSSLRMLAAAVATPRVLSHSFLRRTCAGNFRVQGIGFSSTAAIITTAPMRGPSAATVLNQPHKEAIMLQ